MPAREPESINGKLAYYTFDAVTPLTQGTWAAALAAVSVALSGLHLIQQGERAGFSLCRPPGHHSMRGQYGGYGLSNNVAVAAQSAVNAGAGRVAILDVDVHLRFDARAVDLGLPQMSPRQAAAAGARTLIDGAGRVRRVLRHRVIERISRSLVDRGRRMPRSGRVAIAVAAMIVAVHAAASFGLIDLIGKGYRYSSYFFLIVFVLPLLTRGLWLLLMCQAAPVGDVDIDL